MCGIAGLWWLDGRPVDRAVLERMCQAMAHRGPDGEGYHLDGALGLGHRRLAIVDLQTGGQPLANEDQTLWLVCNGEIYNQAELRRELAAAGHRFATKSDNEVILHLYEECGERLVERLRGMFAFALWDSPQQRLLLGRDRFGIKPLYVMHTPELLAVASEAKALLAVPGMRAELRPECLAEVLLTGCVAGRPSVYRGIERLLPGHTLTVQDGKGTLRRYWSPAEIEPETAPAEPVERLRGLLADAVSSHLMSDVPLGLFLSSGLDSATIGALMAGECKEQVQAFTARLAEADEGPGAAALAGHIGAATHQVTMGAADFAAALPHLVWHHDEPMAFPAAAPLWAVSRLAGERVKVVLTGEGADELWGGYARYAITLMNHRWAGRWGHVPGPLRALAAAAARRLPRIGGQAGRTFLCRAGNPRSLYFENFTGGVGGGLVEDLLGGELSRRQDDPFAVGLAAWGGATDWLTGMMRADLATYLVELLAKQDRMSMAASIESRVPYLDGPLGDFALAMPARLKIGGGQGKVLLRQAAGPWLPPGWLSGPKLGFPLPLARWLRGELRPWVEGQLGSLLRRDLLAAPPIQRALAEHQAGRDRTELLWRLANLELWHQAFIDRAEPWQPLPLPG